MDRKYLKKGEEFCRSIANQRFNANLHLAILQKTLFI